MVALVGVGGIKSLQLLTSRPYAKSNFYVRELEGRGGWCKPPSLEPVNKLFVQTSAMQ